MDSALLSAVPFEWLNEYGVGIPTVDGQHKKLFDMLMELKKLNVEELQNGGNSSSLALMECLSVIGGLMDYTQYHFSTEELLMVKKKMNHYLLKYPEIRWLRYF